MTGSVQAEMSQVKYKCTLYLSYATLNSHIHDRNLRQASVLVLDEDKNFLKKKVIESNQLIKYSSPSNSQTEALSQYCSAHIHTLLTV